MMKTKPDVVIFSNDILKRSGNQLLTRTLEMFLERGLRVTWITGVPDGAKGEIGACEALGAIADQLDVVRPEGAWRGLAHTYGRLKSGLGKHIKESDSVPSWYGSSEMLPYFHADASRVRFMRNAGQAGYNLFAEWASRWLINWSKVKLVVGYEVLGVHPASRIATKLHLPLMTKYQGTAITPSEARSCPVSLRWYRDGLSVFSDLVVMENDGTCGDEVLRVLGHDSSKIRFWVDGVDRPVSYEMNLPNGPITLLSLSTFKSWKRLDRLLMAFRRAREIGLGDVVRLMMVGDGPERNRLVSYATGLGLGDQVQFVGAVPHVRITQYFSQCHALVICNDVSNLSNMVLESLVHHRPVITLDDRSTDGVLTNGIDSIKASTEGELVLNLATAITEFCHSSDLRRCLVDGAGKTGRNLKTWDERMKAEWDCIVEVAPSLFSHRRQGFV